MKLRAIISLLFIIATTITAIHEIEHIQGHNSSSCQICIVHDHSLSFDINKNTLNDEKIHFDAISFPVTISFKFIKKYSKRTRAPPSLS